MRNLPNIEKSGFRKGEYVGYGAGRVWRVRHHTKVVSKAWSAYAMHSGTHGLDISHAPLSGETLADISRQLAALPIESGKLLPTVNAVEG